MPYTVAQSNPDAATPDDLYTVPAGKEAVISTLSVANVGVDASFRIAVRPGGATISDEHYIVYEASIPAGESKFFTIGMALATTDVVTVRASTVDVAFTAFINETDV